jgi:hypothetical protein
VCNGTTKLVGVLGAPTAGLWPPTAPNSSGWRPPRITAHSPPREMPPMARVRGLRIVRKSCSTAGRTSPSMKRSINGGSYW